MRRMVVRGGVMCGGCTIGQGLTAGSMLALSWPLALIAIALGARLGIAVLMEGSIVELLRSMRPPAPEAAWPHKTPSADRDPGHTDATAQTSRPQAPSPTPVS